MLFIDVYKADDKIATSGASQLTDLDMQRTYKAIDSVATGSVFFFLLLLLLLNVYSREANHMHANKKKTYKKE